MRWGGHVAERTFASRSTIARMFGVGSLGAAVGRPLARERVVSSARRGPAPGSTGSTSNAASARTGVVARVSSSRRASVSPSPTPGGSSRLSPLRASGDDDAAAAAPPPTSELEGIREVLAGVRAELTSTSSDPKRKKSALTFAVALVALIAIHLRDPGWGLWNNIRIVGSLLLGAGLALKGLRGGSLDVTGACGASLVGWGTLYAGVRFGVALGVFFFASSAMTRVGAAVKARIDEHHVEGKEGGARNWIQVAANGTVPTFLAMGYAFATGGPEHLLGVNNAFETPLAVAFVGYYACCCGDTWGSELGVLSRTPPRLITDVSKTVKPGTNGGVTPLGLLASAAGGLAVGAAFWIGGLLVPVATGRLELAARFAAQWPVLVVGLGAGLAGSLLDSLLGATVQFSGYCSERERMVSKPGPTVTRVSGLNFLSNSMVNFVSAVTCAVALYYGAIWLGLPRA